MKLDDRELEPIRAALELGVIVETSGSTARPKRVVLSGHALRASAEATSREIGHGGWVLALPLTYIAGIMVVIRTLVDDTPLVDARREPFDAEEFVATVNALPVGTWFTSLVPTQLLRVVEIAESTDSGASALRRFDRILVGGQAVPANLVARATALGARVTKTYGSAETSGGVVYDGFPLEGTRVRVDDDGLVNISAPSLADRYDGDPELTAASFTTDEDGVRWWTTTDLGSIDADGRLTILGRADDIIISGGVKVSLSEIDAVLSNAGIDAVAGWFDDEEWGQVPGLVSSSPLDETLVRDIIENALSKAARPYRFVVVPEIPRLSSGKVDRLAVRQLVQSHGS